MNLEDKTEDNEDSLEARIGMAIIKAEHKMLNAGFKVYESYRGARNKIEKGYDDAKEYSKKKYKAIFNRRNY